MNATYLLQDKNDFVEVLKKKQQEDIFKRADILLSFPSVDDYFSNIENQTEATYGLLVLFDSHLTKERMMKDTYSIGSTQELTNVIQKLSESEPFTEKDFLNAKANYQQAKEACQKAEEKEKQLAKERHSLETAWKNTTTQKDWLEKENQSRKLRLANCQREIHDYETVLKKESKKDEKRKSEIREYNRAVLAAQSSLKKEKEQLLAVNTNLSVIRGQLTLSLRLLHPKEAKEKENECHALYEKQRALQTSIQQKEAEEKENEEAVNKIKEISNAFNEKKTRIENSITTSQTSLEKAQKDIQKGERMVEESISRLEVLRLRKLDLGNKEIQALEEKEKAFKKKLQSASHLLKTWMGYSPLFKKCINMEDVNATLLLSVLFFACGTFCASGSTACEYLSYNTVRLDSLLLYGTNEERPGFWHIYRFE